MKMFTSSTSYSYKRCSLNLLTTFLQRIAATLPLLWTQQLHTQHCHYMFCHSSLFFFKGVVSVMCFLIYACHHAKSNSTSGLSMNKHIVRSYYVLVAATYAVMAVQNNNTHLSFLNFLLLTALQATHSAIVNLNVHEFKTLAHIVIMFAGNAVGPLIGSSISSKGNICIYSGIIFMVCYLLSYFDTKIEDYDLGRVKTINGVIGDSNFMSSIQKTPFSGSIRYFTSHRCVHMIQLLEQLYVPVLSMSLDHRFGLETSPCSCRLAQLVVPTLESSSALLQHLITSSSSSSLRLTPTPTPTRVTTESSVYVLISVLCVGKILELGCGSLVSVVVITAGTSTLHTLITSAVSNISKFDLMTALKPTSSCCDKFGSGDKLSVIIICCFLHLLILVCVSYFYLC